MFPESQMPAGVNAATANQANGVDETEEQVAINLDEKIEVADQSKDINIVPPPPPGGRNYLIQWEVGGEKGIEPRASKKVGTFLVIPLVGHIIAEGTEYHNYKIVDWINSIYSALKQTSPAHDFLYKLGVQVPPSVSQGELKKILEETLAKKPIGTAEIDWKASEKNPADRRANKDGYVTLANRMTQFPKNPDGSYQNFVESKLDGTKCYAQAYVSAHLMK